jgi:hypothetical protein
MNMIIKITKVRKEIIARIFVLDSWLSSSVFSSSSEKDKSPIAFRKVYNAARATSSGIAS